MGIAQIALDPPALSNGQTWKKVPKTILSIQIRNRDLPTKNFHCFPHPFSKTIGLSDEIPKNLKHKVSQGLDPGDDDSLGLHGLQGLPLLCIWFPESAGELI